MSNKIAIFHTVGQTKDWVKLYQNQIHSIIISGLYDECDLIHIGINGIDGNQDLPFILDKMKVRYNTRTDTEADTLKSAWEFSRNNPEYKILYFNNSGVTYSIDSPFMVNKNAWRLYLEYFLVNKWETCVEDLENYDCVSVEWTNNLKLFDFEIGKDVEESISPYPSGNAWWANASYIRTLDLDYIYNESKGWLRFYSEFWIGSKDPKYKCYHNSGKNLYNFNYSPNNYIDNYSNNLLSKSKMKFIGGRKTKIVMIAMFKNESKVIKRMLDSCIGYIDYCIIQDNGSTDGTREIAENFLKENNIPGFVYDVEEGWVGFGWNRDHLLQKCLNTDHGCDWILKMDCDEYLEVDDDFDWSTLDDTSIQSFNVTAKLPGTLYYRTWIWNSKLPWKFNHDAAHETIYIDGVGEEFQRVSLPSSFRQIGSTTGESYAVPTKYVTDSLILENNLIKNNTMLTDLYHFWYVGKSYYDATGCPTFPLGQSQQFEYARRSIYYFEEYVKFTHTAYVNTGTPDRVDEFAYYAMYCIANCYKMLSDTEKAIEYYNKAGLFCSRRNEHLVRLCEICYDMKSYTTMLDISNHLLTEERKCPFPDYVFLLDTNCYYDTGDYINQLKDMALSNIN